MNEEKRGTPFIWIVWVDRAQKSELIFAKRCGGPVVNDPAAESPIPGSYLGPGPPHIVVGGAEDLTVILYK